MAEHRKRVSWTAYCIDLLICTEIGLPPSHETNASGLEYPSDDTVQAARDQFFDARLLKAQAELCQIRGQVIKTVTHRLDSCELEHPYEILGPCLERLHDWKAKLPMDLTHSFECGIPDAMAQSPLFRSLASIYLRYHQVSAAQPPNPGFPAELMHRHSVLLY